jgi:predicted RNA-binding Zn ribbon-like protein
MVTMVSVDQASTGNRVFDLSGGALCLDFVNTLDDRPAPRPKESLESYGDLVTFARMTGSLPDGLLVALRTEAQGRPDEAEAALTHARTIREAAYRLFLALVEGRAIPGADLDTLNATLARAMSRTRLVDLGDGRFGWAWEGLPVDLMAPVWPVVRSIADLLTSPELVALRLCASETCNWLFLDTSRNGSRRWCSMRTCGNRAKARRHHARARAAAAEG